MRILADDIYSFQAILIDLIISNTHEKFSKKILTIYGTVQHFIIFPKHFFINNAFMGRALSL